jgi:2-methylcitrate dehydratase PrpD
MTPDADPSAATDRVLAAIARYAAAPPTPSPAALAAARDDLVAALAAGLRALADPACAALVAPVVPGALMIGGARVPGTSLELDPVQAAFCSGAMLRWLDVDGRGVAPAWGHPADALGGLLALADYHGRLLLAEGGTAPDVGALLGRLLQAQAIQRVTSLGYAAGGADPSLDARLATAAVGAALLGASPAVVLRATVQAASDGTPAATGAAPEGWRRLRWAAAEATSRGVRHALQALALPAPAAAALPHDAVTDGYFDAQHDDDAREPRGHDGALGAAVAAAVRAHYPPRQAAAIEALLADDAALLATPLPALVALLVRN